MVPCRRGAEGYQSTRGETLRIAERWCVIFVLLSFRRYRLNWVYCSARGHRLHLGTLLVGYQAYQLFARCGMYSPCIGSESVLMLAVGSVGELLCWFNWTRAAGTDRQVSSVFSCSNLKSNGRLFCSYQYGQKGETTPVAAA